MKITIDYDNDKIYINPDERYEKSEVEFRIKERLFGNSLETIQSLLEEIFNRLEPSTITNIVLESIDEDTIKTIGEW